jgi:S1-C subfamily serine protease
VVDIEGRVVALNAGGATGAASSFYLPLGRVKRAVQLIQAGKPVPRGTLQTVFSYTPYDELRRLGLTAETEAATRKAFPDNTGMLVVDQIQPGSPAFSQLQTGDILISVDGRSITSFEPLEQLLDDSIGKPLTLSVQRGWQPEQHAGAGLGPGEASRRPATWNSAMRWCTIFRTSRRGISTCPSAAFMWPIPVTAWRRPACRAAR